MQGHRGPACRRGSWKEADTNFSESEDPRPGTYVDLLKRPLKRQRRRFYVKRKVATATATRMPQRYPHIVIIHDDRFYDDQHDHHYPLPAFFLIMALLGDGHSLARSSA